MHKNINRFYGNLLWPQADHLLQRTPHVAGSLAGSPNKVACEERDIQFSKEEFLEMVKVVDQEMKRKGR